MIGDLKRRIGFNPVAWPVYTWRMRRRVIEFETPAPQPGKPHFGVVITPWVGTAVPWYSLAFGLLLAANGSRVTFLFDDLPFGDNILRFRFIRRCIRFVLSVLDGRHDVVVLSSLHTASALAAATRDSVQRLALLNAVWQMRGEIVKGGRQRLIDRYIQQLGNAYGPISQVMKAGAFDVLFVPGGVFGTSGIWAERARLAGIRIASYDTGGYETVMLAANGIACQLQDIPPAFALLKQRSANGRERSFAIADAKEEMLRRRAGVDTFGSQIRGSSDAGREYQGAVLIALNSSWDSAALGLHAVFESNTQWIVETVRHLLENTAATVIVRQHPAERLDFARTSDDYGALLARHFGRHSRLRFIAAAEPVNSYSLLEQVAAVVVYTSTIGIEAAAYGKAVITPSDSYYSRLGFAWRAGTKDEYATLLSQAARAELQVTPEMRSDASVCYYLTQCCNWVFTPFNPADFVKWSRPSLAELHADPKVRSMLRSLQANVPIAFLNHLSRWEAAGVEEAAAQ